MPEQNGFAPAWWLPGPHLPTVFAKFGRKLPLAADTIEQWPTPDGDAVTVARMAPRQAGAPTLALLHGLEGGLHSTYLRAAFQQGAELGWGVAALVWRSCDDRVPAAPRMYHSGETTDTDFFIRRLVAERPGNPLLLMGVSLGANVLCKWLGEQGPAVPREVQRAAAISTPFDLAAGSAHLEQGASRLYARYFVKKLRAKALRALERHPSMPVDRARLLAANTFPEFDDAFTAPVHGFTGAADYYRRSSALGFLPRITVPTLLFSARNDPFLPERVLDEVRRMADANPRLTLDFTPGGGHVGWIGGQPWRPTYYLDRRILSWFRDHA